MQIERRGHLKTVFNEETSVVAWEAAQVSALVLCTSVSICAFVLGKQVQRGSERRGMGEAG